jgi:hypothetical protein
MTSPALALYTAVRIRITSSVLSSDVLYPLYRVLLGEFTCPRIVGGVSLAYVLCYELC